MKNELVKKPQLNTVGGYNCEVFHIQFGWIPFTARADDVTQHGRQIYELIKSGQAGEIAPAPEPDYESLFNEERVKRIQAADVFASNPLKWETLSKEDKAALQLYYDNLNALEMGDDWPEKPSFV